MTDRERVAQDISSEISYQLGMLQDEFGALFDVYPHNFNRIMLELGRILVDKGYTRQHKPNELELVAEKQVEEDLRKFRRASPISNENYQIGRSPEPSQKSVEAIANFIAHALRNWCDGSPESYKILVRSILSLVPEPVLTRISDTEIMAILRCAFTVSIPQGAFDAITNAVEAQLAHDWQTVAQAQEVKGEAQSV